MPVFHMVVTTCLVNVFGSVALMCEDAEPDVMTRPPRNIKTEHLFDKRVAVFRNTETGRRMGELVAHC
eukprot:gene50-65_t